MVDEEHDRDDGDKSGGAGWMATFADMMTLLLTFFVLLLSFATMDVIKFQMMLGSVKDAFGVQTEHPGKVEAVATSLMQLSERESSPEMIAVEDAEIFKELERIIKQEGLEGEVSAEISERGVVMRVEGQALYALGSADLKDEAHPILDRIVTLCRRFEYPLMVEGHTDDLPIMTLQFPSNWELSTARAISAMRYLVDHGIPSENVGVAGYADVRPVVPNTDAAARSRNRRVEFVFIRMIKPSGAGRSATTSNELPIRDGLRPSAARISGTLAAHGTPVRGG